MTEVKNNFNVIKEIRSIEQQLFGKAMYGAQNEAYRREDERKERKEVYNQRVRGTEAVRAD